MNGKKLVRTVHEVARILLTIVFLSSPAAWARQNQQTKEKLDSANRASASQTLTKQLPAITAKTDKPETENTRAKDTVAEESGSSGRNEGIKVHGHWTIEVRDPDGRLAAHREFENSLAPSGRPVGGVEDQGKGETLS